MDPSTIKQTITALLKKRGVDKSICPSEVARLLAKEQEWRALMGPVRSVANELARRGDVEITQGGAVVDPDNYKGPIRLRIARLSQRES